MRTLTALLLPFLLWLGVVQATMHPLEPYLPASLAGQLSVGAAVASLAVAVYHLGIWREQINSTKNNVNAEVIRLREELKQRFDDVQRQIAAIDRHVSTTVDQRVALERWQGRVDTTLQTLSISLASLNRRLEALRTLGGQADVAA